MKAKTTRGIRAYSVALIVASMSLAGVVWLQTAAAGANAPKEQELQVSALDNQANQQSAGLATAREAAAAMGMFVSAEATGSLVAKVGDDQVYLLAKDAQTVCIVRAGDDFSSGSCGPRTNLLRNGGVYSITGVPGDLSAVVAVPDGISGAEVSGTLVPADNNVLVFGLTGQNTKISLKGADNTYPIDFGPLIPPSHR